MIPSISCTFSVDMLLYGNEGRKLVIAIVNSHLVHHCLTVRKTAMIIKLPSSVAILTVGRVDSRAHKGTLGRLYCCSFSKQVCFYYGLAVA